MPELRWILTAIGVVLIVAVYLWSRRERSEDDPAWRREPDMDKQGRGWGNPPQDDVSLPELTLDPGQGAASPGAEGDAYGVEAP